jgi:hypothetical protein
VAERHRQRGVELVQVPAKSLLAATPLVDEVRPPARAGESRARGRFATGQRLASGDFEGGKTGAVKVLGKLGFTIQPR